jgi:hypothetical protein
MIEINIMQNTAALSIAAVIAVSIVALGIAITVVSVNLAHAYSTTINGGKMGQDKVALINKCLNVDKQQNFINSCPWNSL